MTDSIRLFKKTWNQESQQGAGRAAVLQEDGRLYLVFVGLLFYEFGRILLPSSLLFPSSLFLSTGATCGLMHISTSPC